MEDVDLHIELEISACSREQWSLLTFHNAQLAPCQHSIFLDPRRKDIGCLHTLLVYVGNLEHICGSSQYLWLAAVFARIG